MDDGFGHWLAGLLDGEGHFFIRRTTGKPSVNMRADDRDMLALAQARTGVGRLYEVPAGRMGHPQVRWEVAVKAEVLVLAALLDAHPLRSKKAREFAIWREALGIWQTVRRGGVRRTYQQDRMAELAAKLVATRPFE